MYFLIELSMTSVLLTLPLLLSLGKVPTQPWFDSGDSGNTKNSDILTNDKHDWSQPIGFGPQDLGFDSSYMTVGGIQVS